MPADAEPRSLNWRVTLVASTVAFTAYFAMYAFRKPFAAAEYEGAGLLGSAVALKTAFVVSQLLGYATSKYLGIRVCSEASGANRARILLGLVLVAEAALVLF